MPIEYARGVKVSSMGEGEVVLVVGSGRYEFVGDHKGSAMTLVHVDTDLRLHSPEEQAEGRSRRFA